LLFITTAAAFYFYIQSLPSSAPDFIDSRELDANQQAQNFQCTQGKDFNYAYQTQIHIESVLNKQVIYRSQVNFKLQVSQANQSIVKGIAQQISIDEGQGLKKIKDVFFLSRVEPQPFALFTAFNDLNLPQKHPMKVLAQLIKGLSIGQEGENYHFAYDSMQRTYRYHQVNGDIKRSAGATTANLQKLTTSLQGQNDNNSWQVKLGDDCMPLSLHSEERQGIAAAGHSGYIKFTIKADKIPTFIDLSQLALNNFSNSNNQWQTKALATSDFEQSVESEEELWNIIAGFNDNKNTAKLIKAAEFLIDNITTQELADKLSADELSDEAKRDLAFALSLSGHDGVEGYIIDSLTSLSNLGQKGDMSLDLQKVRLMVALSANGKVSEQGFQALASLAKDDTESPNVRNNALINLGSSLQQLENNGLNSAGLEEQLSESLSQAMQAGSASSAILAAGNAQLTSLDTEIFAKLTSSNSKERYAAGSVLSRNPDYTDDMITHLRSERSDLVSHAILSNLDVSQLSSQQVQDLNEIATTASPDLANVINQLIK
jgi:hypothetical protein